MLSTRARQVVTKSGKLGGGAAKASVESRASMVPKQHVASSGKASIASASSLASVSSSTIRNYVTRERMIMREGFDAPANLMTLDRTVKTTVYGKDARKERAAIAADVTSILKAQVPMNTLRSIGEKQLSGASLKIWNRKVKDLEETVSKLGLEVARDLKHQTLPDIAPGTEFPDWLTAFESLMRSAVYFQQEEKFFDVPASASFQHWNELIQQAQSKTAQAANERVLAEQLLGDRESEDSFNIPSSSPLHPTNIASQQKAQSLADKPDAVSISDWAIHAKGLMTEEEKSLALFGPFHSLFVNKPSELQRFNDYLKAVDNGTEASFFQQAEANQSKLISEAASHRAITSQHYLALVELVESALVRSFLLKRLNAQRAISAQSAESLLSSLVTLKEPAEDEDDDEISDMSYAAFRSQLPALLHGASGSSSSPASLDATFAQEFLDEDEYTLFVQLDAILAKIAKNEDIRGLDASTLQQKPSLSHYEPKPSSSISAAGSDAVTTKDVEILAELLSKSGIEAEQLPLARLRAQISTLLPRFYEEDAEDVEEFDGELADEPSSTSAPVDSDSTTAAATASTRSTGASVPLSQSSKDEASQYAPVTVGEFSSQQLDMCMSVLNLEKDLGLPAGSLLPSETREALFEGRVASSNSLDSIDSALLSQISGDALLSLLHDARAQYLSENMPTIETLDSTFTDLQETVLDEDADEDAISQILSAQTGGVVAAEEAAGAEDLADGDEALASSATATAADDITPEAGDEAENAIFAEEDDEFEEYSEEELEFLQSLQEQLSPEDADLFERFVIAGEETVDVADLARQPEEVSLPQYMDRIDTIRKQRAVIAKTSDFASMTDDLLVSEDAIAEIVEQISPPKEEVEAAAAAAAAAAAEAAAAKSWIPEEVKQASEEETALAAEEDLDEDDLLTDAEALAAERARLEEEDDELAAEYEDEDALAEFDEEEDDDLFDARPADSFDEMEDDEMDPYDYNNNEVDPAEEAAAARDAAFMEELAYAESFGFNGKRVHKDAVALVDITKIQSYDLMLKERQIVYDRLMAPHRKDEKVLKQLITFLDDSFEAYPSWFPRRIRSLTQLLELHSEDVWASRLHIEGKENASDKLNEEWKRQTTAHVLHLSGIFGVSSDELIKASSKVASARSAAGLSSAETFSSTVPGMLSSSVSHLDQPIFAIAGAELSHNVPVGALAREKMQTIFGSQLPSYLKALRSSDDSSSSTIIADAREKADLMSNTDYTSATSPHASAAARQPSFLDFVANPNIRRVLTRLSNKIGRLESARIIAGGLLPNAAQKASEAALSLKSAQSSAVSPSTPFGKGREVYDDFESSIAEKNASHDTLYTPANERAPDASDWMFDGPNGKVLGAGSYRALTEDEITEIEGMIGDSSLSRETIADAFPIRDAASSDAAIAAARQHLQDTLKKQYGVELSVAEAEAKARRLEAPLWRAKSFAERQRVLKTQEVMKTLMDRAKESGDSIVVENRSHLKKSSSGHRFARAAAAAKLESASAAAATVAAEEEEASNAAFEISPDSVEADIPFFEMALRSNNSNNNAASSSSATDGVPDFSSQVSSKSVSSSPSIDPLYASFREAKRIYKRTRDANRVERLIDVRIAALNELAARESEEAIAPFLTVRYKQLADKLNQKQCTAAEEKEFASLHAEVLKKAEAAASMDSAASESLVQLLRDVDFYSRDLLGDATLEDTKLARIDKVEKISESEMFANWTTDEVDVNVGDIFAEILASAPTSVTDAELKAITEEEMEDSTYSFEKGIASLSTVSLDNADFKAMRRAVIATVLRGGDESTRSLAAYSTLLSEKEASAAFSNVDVSAHSDAALNARLLSSLPPHILNAMVDQTLHAANRVLKGLSPLNAVQLEDITSKQDAMAKRIAVEIASEDQEFMKKLIGGSFVDGAFVPVEASSSSSSSSSSSDSSSDRFANILNTINAAASKEDAKYQQALEERKALLLRLHKERLEEVKSSSDATSAAKKSSSSTSSTAPGSHAETASSQADLIYESVIANKLNGQSLLSLIREQEDADPAMSDESLASAMSQSRKFAKHLENDAPSSDNSAAALRTPSFVATDGAQIMVASDADLKEIADKNMAFTSDGVRSKAPLASDDHFGLSSSSFIVQAAIDAVLLEEALIQEQSSKLAVSVKKIRTNLSLDSAQRVLSEFDKNYARIVQDMAESREEAEEAGILAASAHHVYIAPHPVSSVDTSDPASVAEFLSSLPEALFGKEGMIRAQLEAQAASEEADVVSRIENQSSDVGANTRSQIDDIDALLHVKQAIAHGGTALGSSFFPKTVAAAHLDMPDSAFEVAIGARDNNLESVADRAQDASHVAALKSAFSSAHDLFSSETILKHSLKTAGITLPAESLLHLPRPARREAILAFFKGGKESLAAIHDLSKSSNLVQEVIAVGKEMLAIVASKTASEQLKQVASIYLNLVTHPLFFGGDKAKAKQVANKLPVPNVEGPLAQAIAKALDRELDLVESKDGFASASSFVQLMHYLSNGGQIPESEKTATMRFFEERVLRGAEEDTQYQQWLSSLLAKGDLNAVTREFTRLGVFEDPHFGPIIKNIETYVETTKQELSQFTAIVTQAIGSLRDAAGLSSEFDATAPENIDSLISVHDAQTKTDWELLDGQVQGAAFNPQRAQTSVDGRLMWTRKSTLAPSYESSYESSSGSSSQSSNSSLRYFVDPVTGTEFTVDLDLKRALDKIDKSDAVALFESVGGQIAREVPSASPLERAGRSLVHEWSADEHVAHALTPEELDVAIAVEMRMAANASQVTPDMIAQAKQEVVDQNKWEEWFMKSTRDLQGPEGASFVPPSRPFPLPGADVDDAPTLSEYMLRQATLLQETSTGPKTPAERRAVWLSGADSGLSHENALHAFLELSREGTDPLPSLGDNWSLAEPNDAALHHWSQFSRHRDGALCLKIDPDIFEHDGLSFEVERVVLILPEDAKIFLSERVLNKFDITPSEDSTTTAWKNASEEMDASNILAQHLRDFDLQHADASQAAAITDLLPHYQRALNAEERGEGVPEFTSDEDYNADVLKPIYPLVRQRVFDIPYHLLLALKKVKWPATQTPEGLRSRGILPPSSTDEDFNRFGLHELPGDTIPETNPLEHLAHLNTYIADAHARLQKLAGEESASL